MKTDSLEKILMLEKIEGRRRRGRQRMKCLDGIIESMDMTLSKLWELVYIWNFSVHILLKPNLKDFEDYLAIM